MQKVGIYSGTFNPPHVGHIRGAEHAVTALGLDKLLLIPDGIAPHKALPEGSADPQQRLEMVRLSAPSGGTVEVSDIARNREGISYAYETVAQVRKLYPDAKLYFLVGTDKFLSFSKWLNADQILKDVALTVLYRGEPGEIESIRQKKAEMEAQGAQIHLLENPVVNISSTQLRRMLIFDCAAPFLAEKVSVYIRENGLYGVGASYKTLPMERLEAVVTSLLKPNRVAHVLGCRDTAIALARHWGANENDAARAGLLHDITKALDGPLQLTLCREYGITLNAFSAENPKTLHALTGSLVARRVFGENDAVVNAIRHHTTGKAGMTLLEKIIYVADYMEPNRDFPGVEELCHLAFANIDAALKRGLEMTVSMLRQQGRTISPQSLEALAYLKETF